MFENMMLNENELEMVTGGCQIDYDQHGNPYVTMGHMECAKVPNGTGTIKAK